MADSCPDSEATLHAQTVQATMVTDQHIMEEEEEQLPKHRRLRHDNKQMGNQHRQRMNKTAMAASDAKEHWVEELGTGPDNQAQVEETVTVSMDTDLMPRRPTVGSKPARLAQSRFAILDGLDEEDGWKQRVEGLKKRIKTSQAQAKRELFRPMTGVVKA